jgi:hypothetical protein
MSWVSGTSEPVDSSSISNTEKAGGPRRAAEEVALRRDKAHRVEVHQQPDGQTMSATRMSARKPNGICVAS